MAIPKSWKGKKGQIKPLLLLIRDGWGHRDSKRNNAIAQGNTPFTDYLLKNYPVASLGCCGNFVGLPKGFMGNSEAGHLTIGSGRVIEQPAYRISKAIKNKSFFHNRAFLKAISNCKKHNSSMHLIGLLQDEGVHSLREHMYALALLLKRNGIKRIWLHIITDGRDAPVKAAAKKIKELKGWLKKHKMQDILKIATISGRYFAMDRDKRWKRTKKAYDAIVLGKAPYIVSLRQLYKNNETDEFIIPRKSEDYAGVKDKDSIIFFNFRADRTRQLTKAIIEPGFKGFKTKKLDVCFVAMTNYYDGMPGLVAFKDLEIKNIFGELISKHGLKQLRISETEKYAHVTFFFNAENEVPFKNESRILISSPKVATYDKKPEMSAYRLTQRLLKEIDKDCYDVIVMNIVNGDMVGHTGVKEACLKAVEVVDSCTEKIVSKVLEKNGAAFVFADHGNIEDQSKKWRTSHTLNNVDFILVSNRRYKLRKKGGLADIAPTALELLNIKQPKEMTGKSLIRK